MNIKLELYATTFANKTLPLANPDFRNFTCEHLMKIENMANDRNCRAHDSQSVVLQRLIQRFMYHDNGHTRKHNRMLEKQMEDPEHKCCLWKKNE